MSIETSNKDVESLSRLIINPGPQDTTEEGTIPSFIILRVLTLVKGLVHQLFVYCIINYSELQIRIGPISIIKVL